jgi:hypothetical protein
MGIGNTNTVIPSVIALDRVCACAC